MKPQDFENTVLINEIKKYYSIMFLKTKDFENYVSINILKNVFENSVTYNNFEKCF